MQSAIQWSCLDCFRRPNRVFCDLPTDALEAFDSIKSIGLYPSGKILFAEGCASDGVHLLCAGRAKLSSCFGNGRQLRLRVAGPGEMLGLSAALTGAPYEATAELLDNSQVAFVRREDLLQFLRLHREACLHAIQLLSQDLQIAYDQVRSIGYPRARNLP